MNTVTKLKRGTFDAYYPISKLIERQVNRDINEKHVANCKTKLELNGWMSPLIVSHLGHLLEGHHRLIAAVETGAETIPAYVVDWVNSSDEKNHLDAIVKLNNGNRAWNAEDFLKSYAKQNPIYKIVLNKRKENTLLSVGNIINIYFSQSDKAFRTGHAKIENIKFSNYLASELSRLKTTYGKKKVVVYCIRETIALANTVKDDLNAVKCLISRYEGLIKDKSPIASSVSDFAPLMRDCLGEYKKTK